MGDHDDTSGDVGTPVAEYQLAGSPRQLTTSSPSSAQPNSSFKLKSPFNRRRQEAESKSEEIVQDSSSSGTFVDVMGDDFARQVVDVVVLDSPQSSVGHSLGLNEIREEDEAALMEEEVGADDDEEYHVDNHPDSGNRHSLHPASGIQNQSGVQYDKTDKADGTNKANNNNTNNTNTNDNEDENDEDMQFQDEEYRYVYLNNAEANARFGYCCNLVITSRFTVYNFIPKLLFYEFKKLANAYFLIISIMQTIKPISNTGGFPASLPALSIIVLIDMFFACLEDYKRHKADHIANELPCLQYNVATRAFEKSKWQLLHVGDVVKVHNREAVPADLVILAACEPEPSNPAGICYVETKSLDGETNLKLRQGLEATYTTMLSDAQVGDMAGVVVCEKPNNSIHRFSGTLSLANGKKEVISTNAILLRGSTLRNTEYIYGLVVNTGPDTKIMMASSSAPMKWSNMEKRLNQQIMYICTLMVVLCLTGAILSSVWNARNLSASPRERAWYLFDKDAIAVRAPAGNFVIQVLYYFLLLNSFIPVSLYVSMTSVKFMQAYFMNNDLEMYHEESDTPCSVRTMSLNEELGQIDYIFSDKTGTLTCNIMEFRKCSINGVSYGHGQTEVGIAAQKRRMAEGGDGGGGGCDANDMETHCTIMEEDPHHQENENDGENDDANGDEKHRVVKAPFVNYQDDSLFEALRRQDKHANLIHSFFEHLAVCHTVMPERASDGSVRLSASSPDEQALVAAAACFGYKFTARAPGKAMVEYFSCLEREGAEEPQPPTAADAAKGDSNRVGEYQILEVLEFNSTRKRMSVIMRGPNGELKLLCKGADTVMYERLRASSDPHDQFVRAQTLQHMETFASEGLRTLVIGATDVDPTFYDEWVVRYRTAINDMRQIELRRLGDANEIDKCMEEIEVDLDVLGATAIEDKLQAGVPDTIHRLRQASIKIWMLTGDKEETAINIGFACRLLTPDIERVVISADTHPDLVSIVEELESYADHPGGDPATDMDGPPSRHKAKSSSAPGATNPNASAATNADGSASDDSTSEADTRPLTRIESIANLNACQENGSALALVIDGETLELALDECPLLLLRVALKCVAVIACRVSPAQKAQLVQLVRDNHPKVRTLAIGDGANDVSMIQSAHVGVGISGQEGMQAANSSDYAIAQFRFLSRLLLVHGRWNYVRMGKLILYIFYKNVMMNLTQFWYMIFTGFSGQKFFLEWGLQGYNLMFTALPIVLISTFEQDVPAYYAHNYPVLYRVGQENSHFNTKIVWAWISSCVWESLVISFGTIFGMRLLIDGGETPNMWVYGCVAFTIVTLVVTLKLCLHQQMWWPLIHLPIYFVSYSLWIATAAFISYGNSVSSAYWNGVFTNVFGTKVFWLLLPLIVLTALSRDFLWKGYMRAFQPSYKHLAQEVNAFGLKHMADYLLSFPPPTSIPRDSESGGAARRSAATAETTTTSKTKTKSKKKQSKKEEANTQAAAAAAAKLGAAGTGPRGARGLGAGSSGGLGSSRKSFTRGSAFSYDAESVMVESFMATDRYHHDAPHETKPMFERHASRGSMAFHTFMGDGPSLVTSWMGSFIGGGSTTTSNSNQASTSLPAHPTSTPSELPPGALGNAERQHSAGNVFRGARHSFGRRRFFSVSTTGSGAAAASTGDLRAGLEHGGSGRISTTAMGGSNRNLRRYERALSGDAVGANASAPHLTGATTTTGSGSGSGTTTTTTTTTTMAASRPHQEEQQQAMGGERHSSIGTRTVRRHTTSATPRKMSA